MVDIRDMAVPIQLTNQEWSMVLRLLKQKAPDSYNRCIVKLEKELREQIEKSFAVYRDRLFDEFFDYDPQEAETQEVPIISGPCCEDEIKEPKLCADSVPEANGPAYTEGDYLLSGKPKHSLRPKSKRSMGR